MYFRNLIVKKNTVHIIQNAKMNLLNYKEINILQYFN